MRKLTKSKLEKLLTTRLKLSEPEFRIESDDLGHLFGSVIAEQFRGLQEHRRIALMRDAIRSEAGSDAEKKVGMLLAFTPDEWYLDSDVVGLPRPSRRKRATA